ncbi:amidohydrolase family protein [Lysobacter sp. GX 14042]|uniref:N-acyl-D-amino-acid deacylase family protein n=1 Tax=Lysobacter sp. GX 14042 TaxID=2907155 RepID=UPI001F38126D|nr:amidohydrolase family protein [Lysobacter sp. GX 14042]MCE7033014.1 amidohydrolase family protein [Lysobacter sp. GX 14042]
MSRPRRPARTAQPAGLLAAALLLTACSGLHPAPPAGTADLLIAGGTVFDGSDNPARTADIAIAGDRVVEVGQDLEGRYRAARTIDARGMIVAPGFIDPHTHPYSHIRSPDPRVRRNLPWLYQGVSTIFIGVDGGGTPDIAGQREWFEDHGVGTNIAAYVGLGPVRRRVLGNTDRAPDDGELQQMRRLVAEAMCQGALGLSTGLFYAPQSFATTDEVVALATEAAVRGGVYDTHQRDESSYSIGLMGSIAEVLEIGRRARIPVHIAHLKALGTDVHGSAGKIIDRIDRARADGLQVTADQYPWLASATGIEAALLPRWSQDGGRDALLTRLDDPATANRIRGEMGENLRRRGGAGAVLMIGDGWPWSGRTLAQMSEAWELEPVDAALRIIRHGGPDGSGSARKIASFNMHADDVKALMQQPWMLTASDGGDGHPRQYATFPEKYARYVVEDGVIDLQAFIHRSTGLSATTFGLEDRGYLRGGYYADVVVFDPARYAPAASYLEPAVPSRGVEYLFVNGVAMIDRGSAADALPGRVLRHRPPAGTCDRARLPPD